MKKIIHFQVPLIEGSKYPDALVIRPETLGKFMQLCENKLGDDYIVIASPCIPSFPPDSTGNFVNFNMNQITKEELMSLLESENKKRGD